jgi:hypothetical protein
MISRGSWEVSPVPASWAYRAAASHWAWRNSGLTMGQARTWQLVRAQTFGAAGEGFVDQVWVGGDLAPDRRQMLDSCQHHRGPLAGQDLAQTAVNRPEVPKHLLLLDIAGGTVAVEDPPGGHVAPVGDIHLQLLLGLLALQGVANPQRDPGQVDFLQPVAGSLQQADLVLAERQHEEVAVAGQQRQQRADMEPVGHHRQRRRDGLRWA